jgi:dolichyl-phosphate mannosyltransferase polypeptide 3
MAGGLLRWQIFTTYAVGFLAMWRAAIVWKNSQVINDNSSSSSSGETSSPPSFPVDLLIDYAPFWAIIVLGIYAGGSVVWGVLNFRDCPEAATEIEQQVVEAKKELQKRGILQSS